MKLVKLYIMLMILVSGNMFNCTEPFNLKTESFEDILVVEATITNELKTQVIKISRTFLLESDTQILEENANIRIEDSEQNVYNFSEMESGIYKSDMPFQAVENISYKLFITTADNKKFESRNEIMPAPVQIDNLYAELETVNGKLGIQVFVDSNENLNDGLFFRYEYEETYKIVVPFDNAFDIEISNVFYDAAADGLINYDINFIPRPEGQETCYSTTHSNNILLTSASDLSENNISRFPIRFIPADDAITSDRYSILVRQYLQSADANNFYKILRELGSSGSVLVDNQPGFIQGNISSQDNSNEKVIGFFDVSSVSSERIYFKYSDFDLDMPSYFFECDIRTLDYEITSEPTPERLILYQLLEVNSYKFLNYDGGTVYTVVNPECSNCTAFSSNIRPEFWID